MDIKNPLDALDLTIDLWERMANINKKKFDKARHDSTESAFFLIKKLVLREGEYYNSLCPLCEFHYFHLSCPFSAPALVINGREIDGCGTGCGKQNCLNNLLGAIRKGDFQSYKNKIQICIGVLKSKRKQLTR